MRAHKEGYDPSGAPNINIKTNFYFSLVLSLSKCTKLVDIRRKNLKIKLMISCNQSQITLFRQLCGCCLAPENMYYIVACLCKRLILQQRSDKWC